MLFRMRRLVQRTRHVQLESGNWWLALAYLFKSILAKAASLVVHIWALTRLVLGRSAHANVTAHAGARNQGQIAISVVVSGGLGDLIVVARCLRDLAATAEPFCFDVFAAEPKLAAWVFAAVPGFARAYPDSLDGLAGQDYAVKLRMNQTVIVVHESIRWPSLRNAPRMLECLRQIIRSRARDGLEPYILNHPRLDNGLARKAVYTNRNRNNFLHSMIGIDYSGDQLTIEYDDAVLARVNLLGRKFITVHNGYDTNFVIAGRRATKCYPHFSQVVAELKDSRPDLLFVQIGTTTSEPISGVDLNLIGQTSLREVAGLLRASALHLDNEGGLVHLAACYDRRSLVVFGPTPSDYFGYRQNINIDPVRCGGCWWIDELWMDRCPRGIAEPECMYSQPPKRIAALALAALDPTMESIFLPTEAGGSATSRGADA